MRIKFYGGLLTTVCSLCAIITLEQTLVPHALAIPLKKDQHQQLQTTALPQTDTSTDADSQFIGFIINPIVDAFVKVFVDISKGVTNAVNIPINGISDMNRDQIENYGDSGVRATDRVWIGLNEAIPRLAKCLKESGDVAWESAVAGANKVAGGPIAYIKDSVKQAYDIVKNGATSAMSKVKKAGTKAYNSVNQAGNDAYSSVEKVGNGIKDSVKGSMKLAAKGLNEEAREEEKKHEFEKKEAKKMKKFEKKESNNRYDEAHHKSATHGHKGG